MASLLKRGDALGFALVGDSLVELHRRWHEEIVAPTHAQLALESG
jgi:hypothetical protein